MRDRKKLFISRTELYVRVHAIRDVVRGRRRVERRFF